MVHGSYLDSLEQLGENWDHASSPVLVEALVEGN